MLIIIIYSPLLSNQMDFDLKPMHQVKIFPTFPIFNWFFKKVGYRFTIFLHIKFLTKKQAENIDAWKILFMITQYLKLKTR